MPRPGVEAQAEKSPSTGLNMKTFLIFIYPLVLGYGRAG